LLPDPEVCTAEVLRMPAGITPSWQSAAQYAALQAHLEPVRRSGART